jgi:hypothetical protein
MLEANRPRFPKTRVEEARRDASLIRLINFMKIQKIRRKATRQRGQAAELQIESGINFCVKAGGDKSFLLDFLLRLAPGV